MSVVLLAAFVGLFAAGRRARAKAHAGSRTVELDLGGERAERTLADGRRESVAWCDLTWVEVVCTRVPTADGASAFVLLGANDEEGCLVPLGVGHDTVLLAQLARLEGFDLRRFTAARDQRPPARQVVWTREEAAERCG